MFSVAGIIASAAAQGGGGYEDPVGGLIAAFESPEDYYSSLTWTAKNDDSYELGFFSSYQPTIADQTATFDANDFCNFNAALISAIEALDDYTVVVVCTQTNRGATGEKNIIAGSGNKIRMYDDVLAGSDSNFGGQDYRSGLVDAEIASVGELDTPSALAVSGERNGTLTVRCRNQKATDTTVSNTTAGATSLQFSPYGAHGGDVHTIRVYDKILSDSDWTTLKSWMSDNADLGLSGVTLT